MKPRQFYTELNESVFLGLANHLPRITTANRIRFLVLRLAGLNIEGKSKIWAPITVTPIGNAHKITIGEGAFLNSEVRFGAVDAIRIGKNVQIGPRVTFETMNHSLEYYPNKGRTCIARPILVEDNVWIGSNAVILQDVTIGEGVVIAAGAVVNKNIPAYVLAGGVPAKPIKQIPSIQESKASVNEFAISVSMVDSHD